MRSASGDALPEETNVNILAGRGEESSRAREKEGDTEGKDLAARAGITCRIIPPVHIYTVQLVCEIRCDTCGIRDDGRREISSEISYVVRVIRQEK